MPESMPTLETECFFIAPIGEDGSDIRHRSDGVLKFIVSRAAQELGLTAIRADQIAAPGQITLQVIDHILQAKAAVADLTNRNPNVFYELAVRHSARLPVALIVAHDEPPLPFDLAQMRVIRFDYRDLESADQCRQAIVAQLREALDGAVDSPIGASVDLRALGSGDRVERSIAEVLTGISELAGLQRAVLESSARSDQRVELLYRELYEEARRLGGARTYYAAEVAQRRLELAAEELARGVYPTTRAARRSLERLVDQVETDALPIADDAQQAVDLAAQVREMLQDTDQPSEDESSSEDKPSKPRRPTKGSGQSDG